MSAKSLYLPLAICAAFLLSSAATARVHPVLAQVAAPADGGTAEAPVAPGDPADLLGPIMKWLTALVTALTVANAMLPWGTPGSKWYKFRQILALAQGAVGHAAAGRAGPKAS